MISKYFLDRSSISHVASRWWFMVDIVWLVTNYTLSSDVEQSFTFLVLIFDRSLQVAVRWNPNLNSRQVNSEKMLLTLIINSGKCSIPLIVQGQRSIRAPTIKLVSWADATSKKDSKRACTDEVGHSGQDHGHYVYLDATIIQIISL